MKNTLNTLPSQLYESPKVRVFNRDIWIVQESQQMCRQIEADSRSWRRRRDTRDHRRSSGGLVGPAAGL